MKSSVRSFNNLSPTIGEGVYVDPSAAVIGNVILNKDVSIWPMAVVRGDVNQIIIGQGTNIQDGAILHATHDGPHSIGGSPLFIGQEVTVGHQAVLHACHIESQSLIGIGALLLDGAYVESHVIVAAGSVVPPGKRLLSGYLYLGSPAKPVRPLTTDEEANLTYSAAHYIQLKNIYLDASK